MLSANFKFRSEQNISWAENTTYRIKVKMESEMYLKDQAVMSKYRVCLQVVVLSNLQYLEYALHMRCTIFKS